MIISLKPFILILRNCRDINNNITTSNSRDIKNIRSNFRIISIDDEDFIHKKDLKELGFNIGYYSSIDDIQSGDRGNIFICDILGVHKQSIDQGAWLMREMRRRYPVAPIIAYTHLTATDRRYQAARDAADRIIRKDRTFDNLVESLDFYLSELNSPRFLWKRLRGVLQDREIETGKIALVEHYFVKSVNSGNASYFSQGVEAVLGLDAKDIAENVGAFIGKSAIDGVRAALLGG